MKVTGEFGGFWDSGNEWKVQVLITNWEEREKICQTNSLFTIIITLGRALTFNQKNKDSVFK